MSSVALTASPCAASSFATPSVFGAEISNIVATPVTNFTLPAIPGLEVDVPNPPPEISFCNVSVTYTHPGQGDNINVETWLPLRDWNGKLQSIGGAGWVAGGGFISYLRMLQPVAEGYVSTTTDAGQGGWGGLDDWALLSPGNINTYALQNLGLTSLNDTAVIAKSLAESYYGSPPSYSYWNGCSQGGRQGLALAQHFPSAYDGIYAAAPAIHWAELIASSLWPVAFMQMTNQYPKACELTRLTALAVCVCDELDGIKDGLIGDPEACRAAFKAESYVGQAFTCDETGSEITLSSAAASVASAIWDGPRFSDGRFMWYGFDIGTNITALAQSVCSEDGKCVALGTSSATPAIRYFVERVASYNGTITTHDEFDHMYRTIKRVFASTLETNEADLTEFRNAGGKLVTYHGLTDAAIPSQGTLHYYKNVNETLGNVDEFYRYFRVPGLDHCWGGAASYPASMFEQLVEWVEKGTAPSESTVIFTVTGNKTVDGLVCAWPHKAQLSADCQLASASEDCWSCAA